MCNLYSMNRSQDEIRAIVGAMRDDAGNMLPLPGIYPDYMAPIVRNGADGVGAFAAATERPQSSGVLF